MLEFIWTHCLTLTDIIAFLAAFRSGFQQWFRFDWIPACLPLVALIQHRVSRGVRNRTSNWAIIGVDGLIARRETSVKAQAVFLINCLPELLLVTAGVLMHAVQIRFCRGIIHHLTRQCFAIRTLYPVFLQGKKRKTKETLNHRQYNYCIVCD